MQIKNPVALRSTRMQGLKGDSHRSRMYDWLHYLKIGDHSWTFTTIKSKPSDAPCPLEPSLPPWSTKKSQNLLHLWTATGNSYFYICPINLLNLLKIFFPKNPNSKWLFLTAFWYTISLWFFVTIFLTLLSTTYFLFLLLDYIIIIYITILISQVSIYSI